MPTEVAISDLLAAPHIYDNCRLRVAGVYMNFHENQCLDGTPPDTPDEDFDPDQSFRIWLDTDKNTKWIGITRQHGVYVPAIVEGLYRHGTCGHCGRYPGQLTEISIVSASQIQSLDQ